MCILPIPTKNGEETLKERGEEKINGIKTKTTNIENSMQVEEQKGLIETISKSNWRWYGHVAQQADYRWIKKLLASIHCVNESRKPPTG